MAHDVFLSYAHEDIKIMERVRDDLKKAGLDVWVDHIGLIPGTPSWTDAVVQAIGEATCLVIILTPNSKESLWVKEEIRIARQNNIRMFPILALGDENTAVPFGLGQTQRSDIRDSKTRKKSIALLIQEIKTYCDRFSQLEPKSEHKLVDVSHGTAPSPVSIYPQKKQSGSQKIGGVLREISVSWEGSKKRVSCRVVTIFILTVAFIFLALLLPNIFQRENSDLIPTFTQSLAVNHTSTTTPTSILPTITVLSTDESPTPTEVPTLTVEPDQTPNITPTPSSCTSNLPARLKPNDRGIVGNNGVNVRIDAGLVYERVHQLMPGDVFVVVAGPLCSDNRFWYLVSYYGGEGWIAEGENDNYFIALLPTATITSSFTPSNTPQIVTSSSTPTEASTATPTFLTLASFPQSTVSPTTSPTTTPTATPTSSCAYLYPHLGVLAAGQQLRVRQAPGILNVIPRQIPSGRATSDGKTIETNAIVTILKPEDTRYPRPYSCWAGRFWWYVWYPNNGAKGWIEEDVLERYS